MTADGASVSNASVDDLQGLEDRASAAAHARVAEWRAQEKAQRPRRVLLFSVCAVVITVAIVLVVFLNRS